MKTLTKQRQGELFIFGGAFLWGLFPLVTILSSSGVNPLTALSISSFFAACSIGVVLVIKKNWRDIFNTSALKYTLLTTFLLGVVYYILIFFGLKHTSAGNMSIISLSEVFFSYLFFHVLRRDDIPKEHVIGSALMILGALIVLYPNIHSFQSGDILVLIASMVAPIGNYFAREARKIVSSESILFIRNLVSSLAIFVIAAIFGVFDTHVGLKDSILFLVINGVFLLGLSKILWVEGIHRISVTKANALSSVAPVLTLLFVWIFFKTAPTVWQSLSIVPMFFGVILLGKDLSRHS